MRKNYLIVENDDELSIVDDNIERLVFKGCVIDDVILEEISSSNIKELEIYDSTFINEEYPILKLDKLVINNCEISEENISYNAFINKELQLDNQDNIDIKKLKCLKSLNRLSLNNTTIINDDNLFFLENTEDISICNCNIDDLAILLSLPKLKTIIIDITTYENNKEIIEQFENKNIKIKIA